MDSSLVAAALFFGLLAVAGSVAFFAVNVRGMLNITVQAPTAEMPASVTDLLTRIDEKLTPAKVRLDDARLDELVQRGVALAEKAKGLKGYDKFRVASSYVQKELQEANAEMPDARLLGLRIEAAVSRRGTT